LLREIAKAGGHKGIIKNIPYSLKGIITSDNYRRALRHEKGSLLWNLAELEKGYFFSLATPCPLKLQWERA